MRHRLQFRGHRGGGDLREHESRPQPAGAREKRRQAAERRIDEPIGPPFADRGERHDRRREQVGGHRDRRAVEVAARDDVTCVGEDHRVVGGAVRLDVDDAAHEAQRVASRAVDLRRAAHRIGVLDLAAELVRLVDTAAAHQPLDIGGRDLLAGVGPGVVNARVERVDRSAQCVDRQRGRDIRGARDLFRGGDRQRQDRG